VVTIEALWHGDTFAWEITNNNVTIPPGAEIRVKARVLEADASTADMAKLGWLVDAWGPSRVVIDRKVVVSERVRSEAMGRAVTIHEQAQVALDALDPVVDAETQARVLVLVDDVAAQCGFAN